VVGKKGFVSFKLNLLFNRVKTNLNLRTMDLAFIRRLRLYNVNKNISSLV